MDGHETGRKPFYKDRDDALEDAGITPKQLRTWREAGLFTAELGPNTRKFTENDIRTLRFLKRLIVGLGLPIQTVQQFTRQDLPWPYTVPLAFTYLNVKTGRLVRPRTALEEMMDLYLATPNLALLEEWLLTIALRCFEEIGRTHRSPKVYEAKRDELLERVRRMDLVARAQDPEDDYDVDEEGNVVTVPPRFVPGVPGDPEPTPDLLRHLAQERTRHTAGIRRAEARAESEEDN